MTKEEMQELRRKVEAEEARKSPEQKQRELEALKRLERYPQINVSEDSSREQVQAQIKRLKAQMGVEEKPADKLMEKVSKEELKKYRKSFSRSDLEKKRRIEERLSHFGEQKDKKK